MLALTQTLAVKCLDSTNTKVVGATGSTAVTVVVGVAADADAGEELTFTATAGSAPSNSYSAAAGRTVLTRPANFTA